MAINLFANCINTKAIKKLSKEDLERVNKILSKVK